MPSPQISVQMSPSVGDKDLPHSNPTSMVQLELHPSPSSVFKSSHSKSPRI
jgi:hypothetical protein